MTSRLYHAVVLVGLSAIGSNVACAAKSVQQPPQVPSADSAATSAVATDAGVGATRRDAAFDAAAEMDAGWHPTK